MALKAGARYVVVTDVNEYRLALAKKMGATAVVNVAKEDLRATMKSLGMSERASTWAWRCPAIRRGFAR